MLYSKEIFNVHTQETSAHPWFRLVWGSRIQLKLQFSQQEKFKYHLYSSWKQKKAEVYSENSSYGLKENATT